MVTAKRISIIGAGPAGIAAAIQLQRQGLAPQLFEAREIGGLLRQANLVENYPGFPDGISGLELAARFAQQLRQTGIEPIFEKVVRLDWQANQFLIETTARDYRSDIVIVATGTEPVVWSDAPADPRIRYEPLSLGNLSGANIAIIGGGDAAFDYALHLAKANRDLVQNAIFDGKTLANVAFCSPRPSVGEGPGERGKMAMNHLLPAAEPRPNQITIINRQERPKALPLLVQRAAQSPNIAHLAAVVVDEVQPRAEHIRLCYHHRDQPQSGQELCFDYLVIAIGRCPGLNFFSPILTQQRAQLEARLQLALIGDVKNQRYRQIAISVGDGLRLAMQLANGEGG